VSFVSFVHVGAGGQEVALHQKRPAEKLCPAREHVVHAPGSGARRIDAHDDVVVVAHHRVGGDVDGEYRSELGDARLDPAAAVVEVLAAVPVMAAQKGAAHAAAHHVVPRRVGERDEGGTGAGHGAEDSGRAAGGQRNKLGVLYFFVT